MLKRYSGTRGICTGTWSLWSPGTIWFVFVVAENMVKLWWQFPACCAVLACTSGAEPANVNTAEDWAYAFLHNIANPLQLACGITLQVQDFIVD